MWRCVVHNIQLQTTKMRPGDRTRTCKAPLDSRGPQEPINGTAESMVQGKGFRQEKVSGEIQQKLINERQRLGGTACHLILMI